MINIIVGYIIIRASKQQNKTHHHSNKGMQEQDDESNGYNQLTKQQINRLLQSCEYVSHIVFPHEYQKLFEERQCINVTNIQEKYKKYDNHHMATNEKQISVQLQGRQNMLELQKIEWDVLNDLQPYHEHLVNKISDFYEICTELFYFMFMCMKQSLILKFHDWVIVYHCGFGKFMVVIEQLSYEAQQRMQEQLEQSAGGRWKQRKYYQLYIKILHKIVDTIKQNIKYVQFIIGLARSQSIATKLQKQADNFHIRLQLLTVKQQQIQTILGPIIQLLQDSKTVMQILQNSKSKQIKYFTQLQKCRFLSTHSDLYNIRNSSINILLYRQPDTATQKQPTPYHRIRQALTIENKLRRMYKQTKIKQQGMRQHHQCQQILYDVYIKIVANFQKYIRDNWVANPLYKNIGQELGSLSGHMADRKLNKGQSDAYRSQLHFKVFVKPIKQCFLVDKNGSSDGKQTNKDMNKTNNTQLNTVSQKQCLEYSVSFAIASSTFVIRLLSPVTIQQYNMDVLIHNWNSLSFSNGGSNPISLQIAQKMDSVNVKKILILKSVCKLRVGESLISHCVRLMDLLMTVYRLIERETGIKSSADSKQQEYESYDRIGEIKVFQKKVQHYTNLMNQLNRKLYLSVV